MVIYKLAQCCGVLGYRDVHWVADLLVVDLFVVGFCVCLLCCMYVCGVLYYGVVYSCLCWGCVVHDVGLGLAVCDYCCILSWCIMQLYYLQIRWGNFLFGG